MQSLSLVLFELKAMAKRPFLLFLCWIGPFLVLGLLAYLISGYFGSESEKVKAAFVDHDQTFETKALITQLQEEETLRQQIELIEMDSSEASKMLEEQTIAGVVTIPEGFTSDLRNGANTPVQVLLDQQQALESSMIQLLLDSGATYISAAQSGVNAAYDLAISQVEEDEERKRLLQQTIVTFTFAALDRNELFTQEEMQKGASVGWMEHSFLAFWMLGSWISISALLFMSGSLAQSSILLRLRSLHILRYQSQLAQGGILTAYLWIISEVLFFAVDHWLSFDGGMLLHTFLLGHALLQAGVITFLTSWIESPGQAALWNLSLCLPILLVSGVLIPQIYLPDWISDKLKYSPWHHLYRGIVEPAAPLLLVLSGAGILFFLTAWLIGWRREERHAYTT
ncbi:ABC transporter permease [Thalassobacillus hwangdonensis]|uniref:ABC transporter permease n=1 Tax=Thalassobacillus hwangdonensis TaxID=546108 RepID=A0ABW3KY13_9BACI